MPSIRSPGRILASSKSHQHSLRGPPARVHRPRWTAPNRSSPPLGFRTDHFAQHVQGTHEILLPPVFRFDSRRIACLPGLRLPRRFGSCRTSEGRARYRPPLGLDRVRRGSVAGCRHGNFCLSALVERTKRRPSGLGIHGSGPARHRGEKTDGHALFPCVRRCRSGRSALHVPALATFRLINRVRCP